MIWVEKHEGLLICLLISAILKIPSLFEPYWYGDEGIYLAIGQAVRQGSVLYSEIHDNKPPLLYLVAAIANGEIFWFKLWSFVFGLLTIGGFYKLAVEVVHKRAVWATVIFAIITSLPILEGNIANAENFFLLFTVLAFYVLYKSNSLKTVFWGGLILGVGGLFKMPPLIEAGIWPVYWLVQNRKDLVKKIAALSLGIILPLAVSGVGLAIMGAGKEYLMAAWAQNLPYLTSWKATSEASGIYSLKNRVLILIAAIIVTIVASRKWQKFNLVLVLWMIFSWFAALMSGRPYPHYLLQTAPALALIATTLPGLGMVTLLMVITWNLFGFYGYPVWRYYGNFIEFIMGRTSKENYWRQFNQQVENNYKISERIQALTDPSEKIFVWGDEPMIYAAARRLPVGKYLVKYHIQDFSGRQYVAGQLAKKPPEILVIFDTAEDFPALKTFADDNYYQIDKIGSAVLWKLKKQM